jgi:20S proteasome subunit alpha 7
VGVRCTDGVIIGVEKLLSAKMLVEGSGRRIAAIDIHIGSASSGMLPDARQLVNRARDEAKAYRTNFGEPIPPQTLADRLGGFTHLTTLYSSVRPFGASLLVAGYNAETKSSELYCIEPSGLAMRYFGTAIGKGARAAKTEIEKNKLYDLTCAQAIGYIAKILHGVNDETKDKPFELELGWICQASDWKFEMVPTTVKTTAEAWAKQKLEEEEMGDDNE